MTRIAPTQKVTVVSSLVLFLTTVGRYRSGRGLKTDSASLKILLDSYATFRVSINTLSLLPGGAKVVGPATTALDALNIPKMLRNGVLPEGVLVRWYYQYIYPITQEVPVVLGRRLINPGIR
jgi:hypothetical protein